MTPEILSKCWQIPIAQARVWAVPLTVAMQEFHIDTPIRQAAFLAQVGHESGRGRFVKELWGPTPTQDRYEGRKDLGNTQPGDGFRFRGRGLIQITGRTNYEAANRALGGDLVRYPGALETPVMAARSAAWWWHAHGLNELADTGNTEKVSRRVNGGTNGLAERIALYEKTSGVLA